MTIPISNKESCIEEIIETVPRYVDYIIVTENYSTNRSFNNYSIFLIIQSKINK